MQKGDGYYIYGGNETFKYSHLAGRMADTLCMFDAGSTSAWRYGELPFDCLPPLLPLLPLESPLTPTFARCGFRNLRRVISQPFIMQLRGCIASISGVRRIQELWERGQGQRLLVQSITMHRVYRPDNQHRLWILYLVPCGIKDQASGNYSLNRSSDTRFLPYIIVNAQLPANISANNSFFVILIFYNQNIISVYIRIRI